MTPAARRTRWSISSEAVALFAEVGDGATERDPGIWTLAAW